MKKLIFLLMLILSPLTAFGADFYSWHWNASNTTPWYRDVAGIPIYLKDISTPYPVTAFTFRLWAGNGGVTGNIKLKVYDSDGTTLLATSSDIDASTIPSYSGQTWYPVNTSIGGYVTFNLSNMVTIDSDGIFLILDHSGYSNMHDVQMATGYGSGWDSNHNKVCYQGNMSTTCSASESLDLTAGITPLQLAYPLGESRLVIQNAGFGVMWTHGECPAGTYKKHAGLDLHADPTDDVFAVVDGTVVDIINDSAHGWAKAIVMEHTAPGGWKYTTVYWHVVPLSAIQTAIDNNQTYDVDRAEQIGDVADLPPEHTDHLHLGVRLGSYLSGVSSAGALPQSDCLGKPAFPNWFIDAADTSYVTFSN
jgi:hypothetical protein